MFKLSKSNGLDLAGVYEKAEDLIASVPFIKKRRRRGKILKVLKYSLFCLAGLLVLVIVSGAGIFFNFRQVYWSASSARDNLTQAISLAEERNFTEALVVSQKAEEDFNLASLHLKSANSNFFISRLPFLKNQVNDFNYLAESGEILSKSVYQAAAIGQELDILFLKRSDSSFSKFSPEEKQAILKLIYESGPELAGLKANLDLAYLSLDQIRFKGIFRLLENKINKIKLELKDGSALLQRAVTMTEILPFWAGYPGKTSFLVLLQNDDELRPTGGFLGTYGILEIKDGEIVRFDTHDIYHMDMPVKDKINIAPPAPLKKYLEVDKWFMRDANWSPDWPAAASQIEWFYKKEDSLLEPANRINNFSGEFSGIIAITPKFVTDLLTITGPVFVKGEEYNKDNFQELLQYKVEAGYVQLGIPSWQRKEVIGELVKELKIKLFDLPFSSWRQILATVSENVLEKNILIYLKDETAQKLVKDFGGAGEIKDVNGDYLMAVDANLAALKTDAVMDRSVNYELGQRDDGLFAKLKINYAHNGGFDWRTTRYRTYTRVYVPEGAKLIKVRVDGKDKNVSEVDIINEFNKTVFGVFVSIEPGEIGSLDFEYKLPVGLEKLVKNGNYSLYVQKQPGNRVGNLAVDLKLKNKVKSYNPAGFSAARIGSNEIRWKSDFNTDKMFGVNF
ncbi:MAG: DUF4012 domain-containing protein [Patescibacteria group bacterium]|nr:DUF4012 domain-containing protein [Patescibacteria group bacterium]MDD5554576.1 DUF4012 domain-containing protein [Patescibacteria group bacterium]